ncbi:MAG TPA: hypothetical protein QF564_20730 [Pirellulaceae bacterium]|jgi:hypothetical protein|nr:hypothetical protein [Pirellulaceae bacterium]
MMRIETKRTLGLYRNCATRQPFDGWDVPDGKSVIAEIYPSIFRKRYPKEDRKPDQHDAYCVARWLTESDKRGILDRYFDPQLTDIERAVADLEG